VLRGHRGAEVLHGEAAQVVDDGAGGGRDHLRRRPVNGAQTSAQTVRDDILPYSTTRHPYGCHTCGIVNGRSPKSSVVLGKTFCSVVWKNA
jgi:hypothetical protein